MNDFIHDSVKIQTNIHAVSITKLNNEWRWKKDRRESQIDISFTKLTSTPLVQYTFICSTRLISHQLVSQTKHQKLVKIIIHYCSNLSSVNAEQIHPVMDTLDSVELMFSFVIIRVHERFTSTHKSQEVTIYVPRRIGSHLETHFAVENSSIIMHFPRFSYSGNYYIYIYKLI